MLLVERDTELDGLNCRVCHRQIRPGERVLVNYRAGKLSLIHATLCHASHGASRHSQSAPSTA
jgi:hypothetical protein